MIGWAVSGSGNAARTRTTVSGIPVKRFRVSGGYVETSLSWYGEAWPLVDEGREQQTAALEALRERLQRRELLEDLSRISKTGSTGN